MKKRKERQIAVSVLGKATSPKQSGENRIEVWTSETVRCIKKGRATLYSIAVGRRYIQVYRGRIQVPTDFAKFA